MIKQAKPLAMRPSLNPEHMLPAEQRVLILAPLGRDAALLGQMLSKLGFVCNLCKDATELQHELTMGAGVVLLTEEALTNQTTLLLSDLITTQPTWSDLPIILLVSARWQRPASLAHISVTLLERPVRIPTLTTVAGALLRARQRQYHLRDLLAQQERANEMLELRVRERTEALKSSHAQTQAEHQQVTTILRSISDAFIALDHTYRIVRFNQKGAALAKQVSRRRTDELLGKTLWETFPNSEHSPFGENYRRAVHDQVSVAFEEYIPALGIWFEVRVYPSAEGSAAYFQDITQRKDTERSLRSSEERFAKAFRSNPVAGCLMTLVDETFLDANERFQRLSGYSREEISGRSSQDIGLWTSKLTANKIQEAIRKDGRYQDLALQLKTKTGEIRDILASAEVMDLDGIPVILHMFYDVTNQKRSEEELTQAIESVLQDSAWFSRSVVEKLAQVRAKKISSNHEAEVAELSKREKQVLEHIATGHDDASIATALGLSRHTIRNYISNIYEKLGIHSRAEAVVWARERGLSGSR